MLFGFVLQASCADAEPGIKAYESTAFRLRTRGGSADEIVQVCNRGLALNPKSKGLLWERANAYLLLNEREKALIDLNNAIKFYPTNPGFYNMRATVLHMQKQDDEALKDYSKTIDLQPWASNYESRGEFYMDRKEYAKALKDYNSAVDALKKANISDRGLVEGAHACRAKLYEKLNRQDDAIADYTIAIYTDPIWKAGLEAKQISADQLAAMKKQSGMRGELLRRAKAYEKKGDFKNALRDIDLYLRVKPSIVEARLERMHVLRSMGDYKKALEECTGLIKDDPGRPDLYYQRAKIFEKLGDSKSAKHDIARAEEIEREMSASQ